MLCQTCGKDITDQTGTCLHCGTAIHPETATPPPLPPGISPTRPLSGFKPISIVLSVLGALVLLAGIGLVALWRLNDRPSFARIPNLDQPPLAKRNTAADVAIHAYVWEKAPPQPRSSKAPKTIKTISVDILEEDVPLPPPPPPALGSSWKPGSPIDPQDAPLVMTISPTQDYSGYALTLQGAAVGVEDLRQYLTPAVQLQPMFMRMAYLYVHDDVPVQVLSLMLDELHLISERAMAETRAKPEMGGLDGGVVKVLVAPIGSDKVMEIATARICKGMNAGGVALPISRAPAPLEYEQSVTYPMLALGRRASSRDRALTLRAWESSEADQAERPQSLMDTLRSGLGKKEAPEVRSLDGSEVMTSVVREHVKRLCDRRVFVNITRPLHEATRASLHPSDFVFGHVPPLLSASREIFFRLFADHSGSFEAFRPNGGRNAATILSLRYSSSR